MKKNYFFAGLLIASAGLFAFQTETGVAGSTVLTEKSSMKFSGGGMDGATGAPGENNCTLCHNGSVLDGSNEHDFSVVNSSFVTVTSYNPGEVYTVSFDLISDPAKKGFSATALDGNNNMAGSFTGSGFGGTQDYSAGGRDYVSHTSTSNTDGTAIWAWTWTAPATNVGDVTFYFASNEANNDGSTNGDMIYLSQQVIGSVASIDEKESAVSFNAGYSAEGNKVVMDFTSLTADDMFFNLVDLNGKSVYTKQMSKATIGTNKQTVVLPASIENGMYVVNFFIGNKPMSTKIMVQK